MKIMLFKSESCKLKKGFTLAEVLITLAIIGIVASLTIPSVVKNYKATQLESQFKKAYSDATQAVLKMQVQEGGTVYDYEDDVNEFRNKFMEYFSVLNACKTTCFDSTLYKTYNKNQAATRFFARSFITKDGMYYNFYKGGSRNIYITVDINGFKKGPNLWGHDIFSFYVPPNQVLKPCYDHEPFSGAVCNKNSTSEYNGVACAKYALLDKNYFKNLP